MEKQKTTLIQVKRDTWFELNKRKLNPNESFDDVINRMLLEFPVNEHSLADSNITKICEDLK